MANDYFKFKEFTIWHDKCAMKVGTDGVLLGSWVSVDSCKTILDVGTGTGLIALMLAQRCDAEIDVIDIDNDAYEQAKINISASRFLNRIDVFHNSLNEYANRTTKRYDLIVSNPPYFVDSLKSPDEKRSLARHSDSLSMDELFRDTAELLNEEGRLALILPSLLEQDILSVAMNYGFYIERKTYVKPTPNALPKRILFEFSKKEASSPFENILTIEEERHQYTPEYITLTKDFYLKM